MKTRTILNLLGILMFAVVASIAKVIAQPSEYVGHTQTSDIPFEQCGGYHHYVGQMIKPTSSMAITQIDMEMTHYSGYPNYSSNATVSAEIWKTDMGNSWTVVSITGNQTITGGYSVRSWEFDLPVVLEAGHSYFVGLNAHNGYIVLRGDHSGAEGTGANIDSGVGSPDGYYQESWEIPHNSYRSGAGTGYVTTYSILACDLDYWWHSQLTQTQRNQVILARAVQDLNLDVGLNCKQWVQAIVPEASYSVVAVPTTYPDADGYQWSTSEDVDGYNDAVDIEDVVPGMIVQMNLGATPHTAIVYEVDESGFWVIDSNFYYISDPNTVKFHYWTFTAFNASTSGNYTVYWML